MKICALVLLLCIVTACAHTLSDQQMAKLKELKLACISETGVDKATIDRIIAGEKVLSNDKLNCFATCMLKKIGITRADGTVNVEKTVAMAVHTSGDKAKMTKVINKCKDLKGKDACETGGAIFACLLGQNHFTVLY